MFDTPATAVSIDRFRLRRIVPLAEGAVAVLKGAPSRRARKRWQEIDLNAHAKTADEWLVGKRVRK